MSKKTLKEQLFVAIEEGDRQKVEQLMEDNTIIANVADEKGHTLLHHAAALDQVEIAEFLVNIGADVNKENKGGGTPLYVAAAFGKTNVAEFLIAKGADLNKVDKKFGYAPLHIAAKNGHIDIVQLLDSRADLTLKDKYDKTPMYYLCNYLKEDRQTIVKPNVRDTLIKSVKIGCIALSTGVTTAIILAKFIELPPSLSAEAEIVFSIVGKIAFSAIGATALATIIASAYMMLKPSTEMHIEDKVEEYVSSKERYA